MTTEVLREFFIKYRIFIIPAVVGLVSLLIIAFVIIPQVLEIFIERGKVGELNNKIVLLNKKAADLNSLDENVLQKELTTALTVMPTNRDVPQTMAVLQGLISKYNLSLKSTTYSSGGKTAQNSFQLTISILGSLQSTRDFINSLREAQRIFKVESIILRFQPEGNAVATDLPITVFYQPAPTAAISVDAPIANLDSNQQQLLANLTKLTAGGEIFATAAAVPVGKADPFQ